RLLRHPPRQRADEQAAILLRLLLTRPAILPLSPPGRGRDPLRSNGRVRGSGRRGRWGGLRSGPLTPTLSPRGRGGRSRRLGAQRLRVLVLAEAHGDGRVHLDA